MNTKTATITFGRIVVITMLVLPFMAQTTAKPWVVWVKDLRADAIAQGIDPATFDRVFADVKPNKKVMRFDKRQPEKRLTYLKYRNTRADRYRIRLGQKEYRRNQTILKQVGQAYGVDPCVITALWGMETSYGRFMGSFDVVKSLATLAYDGRRAVFFRKELLLALRILDEGHVPRSRLKGEWAGASGQPQFLPSSWYRFAVDYDGDGKKNIWTSLPDTFASIANYLVGNGWESNQSWGFEVSVPKVFDASHVGLKITKPVHAWLALGLSPAKRMHPQMMNMPASLVRPHGGPDYLVFQNYKTIMRYNRSIFYAGTIAYLADSICQRK